MGEADTGPVYATKYQVPSLRINLVQRARLLDRLAAGRERKLTLISAPAGFGKTTLLTQWIAASGSSVSVAWLSLDEVDNDPAQFLRYLVAALQQVEPRIGQTALQVLRAPGTPGATGVAATLINDIVASGAPLMLVLDDYQAITAPEVHEILGLLVEHLPTNMHLVLSSREDPPLPLPRLRARGQITEIRERDLRFTGGETGAFVTQTMGLRCPEGALQALAARTEGWVAGLQLAALALQEGSQAGGAQAESFVSAFSGDDRYVMDYLMTEVLERQPSAVRDFLLGTAVLDRLSAPLCDALLDRSDSRAMLEHLERANLFLMALDHRREWYRYYRLFAEFLRSRLDPAQTVAAHRRAAQWFEAQGLMSEAVRHALAAARSDGPRSAASAAAWDDAVRLLRAAAEDQFQSGSILTLDRWLAELPEARLRADGELGTYRAWCAAITGHADLAEPYAAAAEAALPTDRSPALARLMILRGMTALGRQDYESSIAHAQNALALLGPEQARWRVLALWQLAEAQERTRPIAEAIASLHALRASSQGLRDDFFVSAIDGFLASALNTYGQRRAAVRICEDSLAAYGPDPASRPAASAFVVARLALLQYEADQLDEARGSAARGLALAEQLGLPDVLSFALGINALVANAAGEPQDALAYLGRARRLTSPASLADTSWLRAWEANIYLLAGDVGPAVHWAEAEGLTPEAAAGYLQLEPLLTYARLLLARDSLPEVRRLLARLAAYAQDYGFGRWSISIHLLQARACLASGEESAAREHVLAALKTAVPEGYLRAFLDEDRRVLNLLAPIRYVAPDTVDRLLAHVAPAAARTGPASGPVPLIEPLSERELEVLRLIAAGLSNADIALRLVIALGTVKRHINNIYGKLGVETRTQAIARARELGLL